MKLHKMIFARLKTSQTCSISWGNHMLEISVSQWHDLTEISYYIPMITSSQMALLTNGVSPWPCQQGRHISLCSCVQEPIRLLQIRKTTINCSLGPTATRWKKSKPTNYAYACTSQLWLMPAQLIYELTKALSFLCTIKKEFVFICFSISVWSLPTYLHWSINPW